MSDYFMNDIADRVENGTASIEEVVADLISRYDDRSEEYDEKTLRSVASSVLKELRERGYDVVRIAAT
jgi:phosphoserine phosphatase